MRVTIVKNTDQLNYEDFLGGITRIVTIAGVKRGAKEAQYDIAIEGDDRSWRPPPTVLKQLVAAWGDETERWVGRRAMLYGDPAIMMAGQKVGGIRVSHLSHISAPVTENLSVTRGKRKPHTVDPLPDAAPPALPAALIAKATEIEQLQGWWKQHPSQRAAIEARVAEIKGAEQTAEDAFEDGA